MRPAWSCNSRIARTQRQSTFPIRDGWITSRLSDERPWSHLRTAAPRMKPLTRDKLSRQRRSWNMSRIRGKDTTPELLVRRLLHSMGYRFRLHVSSLPGRPDIVLAKYRTVIFVHGCFWHRHSGCKNCSTPTNRRDFWVNKLEGNARRDRVNGQKLRELGWCSLVAWECETEKQSGLRILRQRFRKALRLPPVK